MDYAERLAKANNDNGSSDHNDCGGVWSEHYIWQRFILQEFPFAALFCDLFVLL